ncbi:MAG TPA: SRPBCC family protein [Jatrophihabitans sp.]|nr:SRPBCC family protein [Jatrophihabitans sp.]
MALVRAVRRIEAPVELVWDRVTDWQAHGRWIPLTVVSIDQDSPATRGLGTKFTGRTALGPLGFDDLMTVTEWQPPHDGAGGRCRIEHRGRWVGGWAEILVEPDGAATRLSWIEDVQPRWTPRFVDAAVSRVGTVLFGGTLRKLAAELEG